MSWLEKSLKGLLEGSSGGRPMAALREVAPYVLFRQGGGVFQLQESSGLPSGFQYGFLESDPGLWSAALQDGAVRLPSGHGLRSDGDLWVAVDRPGQPGLLLVAELPPGDERDGHFLRMLLALESGRRTSGGERVGEELPVWLRDFPGKIQRLSSPALLMSEPGSGMEELVRAHLREQFGSEEEGIFFHPGRLSEAVQLREIFGDSAGARLGGAGAGLPLLERPGRLVFIQEAALLSHQVQLRLYARLAGEEDGRFWVFGSSRDLEAMAEADS